MNVRTFLTAMISTPCSYMLVELLIMLLESCFCYCCRMSMQVCAKILALCMFACVRVFRYLCLLIGTNTYTGRCCSCCCLWLWSFFILFCFGEWTLPAWHSETRLLYYAGQDGTTATCRSFFFFFNGSRYRNNAINASVINLWIEVVGLTANS